jgi:hypothetical protein
LQKEAAPPVRRAQHKMANIGLHSSYDKRVSFDRTSFTRRSSGGIGRIDEEKEQADKPASAIQLSQLLIHIALTSELIDDAKGKITDDDIAQMSSVAEQVQTNVETFLASTLKNGLNSGKFPTLVLKDEALNLMVAAIEEDEDGRPAKVSISIPDAFYDTVVPMLATAIAPAMTEFMQEQIQEVNSQWSIPQMQKKIDTMPFAQQKASPAESEVDPKISAAVGVYHDCITDLRSEFEQYTATKKQLESSVTEMAKKQKEWLEMEQNAEGQRCQL